MNREEREELEEKPLIQSFAQAHFAAFAVKFPFLYAFSLAAAKALL